MKITNFEVKDRKLNKLNSVTYTGDFNVDTFHFDFDEEWNGLEKTLVIIADKITYNVPLLNDEAILPNEVYVDNQSIGIGVFGRNENTILSSNVMNIWINKGAYMEGEKPSNLPTPTQWDLYVEQINKFLKESKINAENCEEILFEVRNLQNEFENTKLDIEVYNQNHFEKVTEYNQNSIEKTQNFYEVVESKKSEFNNYTEIKKQELENFAKTITVITSGTDDLIDGESELPAGSMYLVYETDEDEVNQDA